MSLATALPTPKLEAWKYTNLAPLRSLDLARADAPPALDRAPTLLADARWRAVFVNGVFHAGLSRLDGLPHFAAESGTDGLADPELHPLVALNEQLLGGGYVLRVPRGVVLEEPIEIVHAMTGGAAHLRFRIALEPGAQATVVERHVSLGAGESVANLVTEADLGRDVLLRIWKLQEESSAAFHLAFTAARLAQGARLESATLTLGARLSRNETHVDFAGPGAECALSGAYALRGRQHCDNTTVVTHGAPGCASRQVFKGVMDDSARGVFQGRIWVEPRAQKTDGHQLSRALLLSDKAEIDVKPELHIYADDVKCSHGATAGELDPDAMFYLRARGVPEREARSLLVQAFLEDAVSGVAHEATREAFQARIAGWMQA